MDAVGVIYLFFGRSVKESRKVSVDGPVKEAADITSAACNRVEHDPCHETKKRVLRGSAPKRLTKVLSDRRILPGSRT